MKRPGRATARRCSSACVQQASELKQQANLALVCGCGLWVLQLAGVALRYGHSSQPDDNRDGHNHRQCAARAVQFQHWGCGAAVAAMMAGAA